MAQVPSNTKCFSYSTGFFLGKQRTPRNLYSDVLLASDTQIINLKQKQKQISFVDENLRALMLNKVRNEFCVEKLIVAIDELEIQ